MARYVRNAQSTPVEQFRSLSQAAPPWNSRKADLLHELDVYLDSANAFIGEAEKELRHKGSSSKNMSPIPPPRRRSSSSSSGKAYMSFASPVTEVKASSASSGPFIRSAWGYSSLNSAARRGQCLQSGWDRRHCGQAGIDALLDAGHNLDESIIMDIGEIEKLTQALVLGLDNIDEEVKEHSAPESKGKQSPTPRIPHNPHILVLNDQSSSSYWPSSVTSTPDALVVSESFNSTVPILPSTPRELRRGFRRDVSNISTRSELDDSFPEEFCDPGEVSPSWQFVDGARKTKSCDSLNENDHLNDSCVTRLWTSEESISNKTNRALMKKFHESPGASPRESIYQSKTLKALDNQLNAALMKIMQDQDQLQSPVTVKAIPTPAAVKKPIQVPPKILPKSGKQSAITLSDDMFEEFEAEFKATLTRPKRKFAQVPSIPGQVSTLVDCQANRKLGPIPSPIKPEAPARVKRSHSNSAPKGKSKNENRSPVGAVVRDSSFSTQRPLSTKETNIQLRAKFFAELMDPNIAYEVKRNQDVAHDRKKDEGRKVQDVNDKKTVYFEESRHPLLISYRSALEKNAAVLQSNPDLSQIISNVRSSEQRKSLVIPSSKEKSQLPHNCRPLEKRGSEENNNNSSNKNSNSTPRIQKGKPQDHLIDSYSQEFENSMESLESFCRNLQLDTISASFDAEFAKMSPLKKIVSDQMLSQKVIVSALTTIEPVGKECPSQVHTDSEDCLSTGSGPSSIPSGSTDTMESRSSGVHTMELKKQSGQRHVTSKDKQQQQLPQLASQPQLPIRRKTRDLADAFLGHGGRGSSKIDVTNDEREETGEGTTSRGIELLMRASAHERASVAELSPVRPSKALRAAAAKGIPLPRPGQNSTVTQSQYKQEQYVQTQCKQMTRSTSIEPDNRSSSPDIALYELNRSEQILNNLVKSSTDPAVAELLSASCDSGSGDRATMTLSSTSSVSNSYAGASQVPSPSPVNAVQRVEVCLCGKPIITKSNGDSAKKGLCKKCSSSKAMRFLHACTSYAAKTNSLPILRKDNGDKVKLRSKNNDKGQNGHRERQAPPPPPHNNQTSTGCILSSTHEVDKSRSNSVTDLNEAEAVQALEWLRQTGFPQYVQMYEDNCFPLDMSTVYKDHPHLDADEIQSLLRRLNTLNKCARMKTDAFLKLHSSDEDLALSDNWQFHRPSRRWSRIVPPNFNELPLITKQHVDTGSYGSGAAQEAYSSRDSVFLDSETGNPTVAHSPDSEASGQSPVCVGPAGSALSASDERIQQHTTHSRSPTPSLQSKLRRSGSERIRDAIIRKVDSFRRRRREARSRSPKSHKMGRPGGAEQDPSTTQTTTAHQPSSLHAVMLPGQTPAGCLKKAQGTHNSPKFLSLKGKRRGECYDNQALLADLEGCDPHSLTLNLNLSLTQSTQSDTDVVGDSTGARRDSGVGSSITRTSTGSVAGLVSTTWHCYPGPAVHPTLLCPDRAIPLSQLTACQHMILRKHALLRLTALMERYSPPYKTGWAWSVPKFIKKMTTPNYKDKVTFGVPLSAHIQRSGHPLPPSIQTAMQFVASVAPRCGGVFRKPGVRSRIEKLRALHETHALDAHLLVYESQQCYDVADMVKQYFRELPEGGLLTANFSQTFLYIFMHIPEEHRLEALQCAVLILPDENREVLETLLCFLDEVAQASQQNGMTASNLALCFAPSIFQLSQTTSPKRKRNNQLSGEREICENRAGNECLCKMIEWHQELFAASVQILQSARLALEDPTDIQNFLASETPQPLYKLHLDSCLHWLLHEVRLNKGWTQVSHSDLELAYKKVNDDYHYIRLWKCSVLGSWR
ncbi:uncharacterized protein LOC111270538 isoform X2 [Varroa jacobsoni]|uniref:uncharacterized protein LOC111270538 isoform X2 n=1 Tax=Varroa jacobsoni TaxID=62625 RepID=UPI000BF602F8|nr:uncharacterized protein LOC111270538 isoform X2 [Varroa jacobsoni]